MYPSDTAFIQFFYAVCFCLVTSCLSSFKYTYAHSSVSAFGLHLYAIIPFMPLCLYTFVPLCLYAFMPLYLCAFKPLCLYAFMPLSLYAFMPFYSCALHYNSYLHQLSDSIFISASVNALLKTARPPI